MNVINIQPSLVNSNWGHYKEQLSNLIKNSFSNNVSLGPICHLWEVL